MVVDIHCHILPGVDDGAKTSKSTMRMLKIAAEEGTDVIIATPHFVNGTELEKVVDMKRRYIAVKRWMAENYPEMQLYLGNELFYSDGIVEALEQKVAMTINNTRYVLVEFPIYAEFAYVRNAVQNLLYAGYIPVIAHVERYEEMHKKSYIEELVEMGAYIQVNASSVVGKHGFKIKHYVKKLLKADLVHFVGTDAHGSKHRRPEMQECRDYLVKKLGVEDAYRILEENPMCMLRGEEIDG